MNKIKVAIIGSGNIGTDLMIKVMRTSKYLEMGVFVGIDPNSDGLARAQRLGVATTHEGIEGLLKHPLWPEIGYVFDATSAKAHVYNYNQIKSFEGKRVIDLTPAAIGPFMVPPVNFDALMDVPNVNMVTCGGQATIPMVAAVNRVAKVHYGEIVASIASKSAGPGTRANIDEFTETAMGKYGRIDVSGLSYDFVNISDANVINAIDDMIESAINLTDVLDKYLNVLKKINKTHQSINVHGNNCGPWSFKKMDLPNVLEITYLRKTDYEFKNFDKELTEKYNMPNCPKKPEMIFLKSEYLIK